jgi:hypothetical protein
MTLTVRQIKKTALYLALLPQVARTFPGMENAFAKELSIASDSYAFSADIKALTVAFEWSSSPQGFEKWSKFHASLKDEERIINESIIG